MGIQIIEKKNWLDCKLCLIFRRSTGLRTPVCEPILLSTQWSMRRGYKSVYFDMKFNFYIFILGRIGYGPK